MILIIALCCFLGLGALQPSCATPRSYENNIVEVKGRNNLFSYGDYSCISVVEFLTRNETYYDFSDAFFNRNTIGDTYTINIFYNWRLCQWSNILFGNLEYSYNNSSIMLGDLEFKLYSVGTRNNVRYQDWSVYLYTSDYSDHLTYNISIIMQYDSQTGFSRDRFCVDVLDTVETNTSLSVGQCFIVPNDDFSLRVYNMDAFNTGYQQGYLEGNNAGYIEGVSYGATHPNETTYNSIYQSGRQAGYSEGVTEAQDQTTLASQIFTGCVDVGLLPVNVFLQMFEYEVFGINIAGFVSALMTIAIVIIIIRMVTGGKNDK